MKPVYGPGPAPIRWGFIGAGKMATALIQGLIRVGMASPAKIAASDPQGLAREAIAATGIAVSEDNREVARSCDVIVLAVKPQQMRAVFEDLQAELTSRHLVISIAAGTTLATLEDGLGPDLRLVRVMPNTAALVGEGAAGYCLGPNATAQDEATVRSCLGAVGRAYAVPEPLLDAVTGLAGSGPAFVFLMIEALSDGGVRMGLPRATATEMAAQTVLGAAKLVLVTGLHPGVLKDQVASPAGTTIAGLQILERDAVRGAFLDAVEAATLRATELGAS
jgi:pyrroline-5-carboxylate reductase